MCSPPEPFFSWAGRRERSRVQIIGFLGLHAVTPHELLEEDEDRQMTSGLTQFNVSWHTKTPRHQKATPELFSELESGTRAD